VELGYNGMSVFVDGLSLKRPYDPSSQEDLSHLAKAAAVEVKKDEDDANQQTTSEVIASPDPAVNGNKLNSMTSSASVLLVESDNNVQRHMTQAELILKQIVDSKLGVETKCPAASSSDTIEPSPVRSVPYPSPPLHSQGPGGGNAGTFSGQIFDSPAVVQTIDLTSNFVQHPTSTVAPMVAGVAMDFVRAQTAGIIMTEGTAASNSGEPQPKRQAAFADSELPVHVLMQLVAGDAPKLTQDDKMQWLQVGGHGDVEGHHGHADTACNQPADSFAFAPKINVDVANVNNEIIFNFGHNVVFTPPFPSPAAAGFGDGQPVLSTSVSAPSNQMNVEDVRMSSGPQSMETNIATFTTGSHSEGFINADVVAFGQNSSMSQNGGMFIGTGSGRSTQSVIGMDISGSPMPGSAMHPAPIAVQSVVDLVSSQFSSPDGGGFGSSQHGFDELHGFDDSRSEMNMDIAARQIAGMNLPDTMTSPLSIVTSSVNEAGNLRQSLAELIDLQQQVAASSNGANAGSAPQSPPYRRSSISRHEIPAQRELVTSRPVPDTGAQWSGSDGATWPSDAVFHDSLSTSDSQPSAITSSHGSLSNSDGLPGQSVTVTLAAPSLTKPYGEVFAGGHLEDSTEVFTTSHGVFATSANDWTPTMLAPSSDETLLSGSRAEKTEKEKPLDINLLQMLVKDGGIWDPNVGLAHNKEMGHTDVIDELFAGSSSAHASGMGLPTVSSEVQSPAGNMYSILVGSSQAENTAHQGMNSPTELPLSTQSLVMSGTEVPVQNVAHVVHLSQPVFSSLSETPPTLPFVLVTSLQSQDMVTTGNRTSHVDSRGYIFDVLI
jgi:hypothetical protein